MSRESGRHRHLVLRDGDSWEFRTSADAATIAKPGYPESVAMIVQIGDHLSKQYDVKASQGPIQPCARTDARSFMFHRPAFALFALLMVLQGQRGRRRHQPRGADRGTPGFRQSVRCVRRSAATAVLILHGRQGITPIAHYERLATALAAAGIDAWLFSYYSRRMTRSSADWSAANE